MKLTMSSLRRHWLWLFIIGAPMILFAPFLLGLRVLYWATPLLQFYPWRKLAFDLLRAGQWPLWNPYLGNGAPLLANLQSATFYPPNWLGLILPLEYSFSWLVALHWIWAGAGMVMLARSLGLRPLGQAVAGLAFGLCQYLVARAWFFSINAAVAWLPWVIWAGDRALASSMAGGRRRWARDAWLLALFVALQLLAGHAQTAWYTLLLLGAWALWRTFSPPAGALRPPDAERQESGFPRGAWEPAQRPMSGAVSLLLPLALAGLMAALQLLPTAELLRQSPRADAAEYEFVMTYSFSPWRLLTLLMPDVLGNPARGQYYGYGNYWEDAVYAGVLPLLLAAGALWQALRRQKKPSVESKEPETGTPRFLVPFLALVMLATLVLALGRNTPVFPFLYRHVPTFNLFQAPTRMMVWFEFALALLAGVGAGQLRPLQGRARRWALRAAVGSVSVILTGLIFLVMIPGETALGQQFQTVSRALATLGVTLLLAFLLLLTQPGADSGGAGRRVFWWQMVVMAFIAADLVYAGWGLNPGAAPDLYRAPSATGGPLQSALNGHRLFEFPDDEYFVQYSHFLPFKRFGPRELAAETRAAQLANVALLDGLPSANNYEPLLSARYAGFMDVVSATSSLNLVHLMDVGVVANSLPLSLEVVAVGGPVTFYRTPDPDKVSRVRVVYAARTVPDARTAKAALADPSFDPEREVILEADDAGPSGVAPPSPFLPSVNGPSFSVSLRAAGWVVISETCYPGWAAYVDGQPAPLRCGDYAFWAVAAPAGEHTVTLHYQPLWFAVGVWVSVVGWLVWGMLCFWLRF